MDYDPSDLEVLLWFSAETILGAKEVRGHTIEQLAEKIRAMPERNPAFAWNEVVISCEPWSVRKARGACWLRIFEARHNHLALGK